jgi:hypothetical protein
MRPYRLEWEVHGKEVKRVSREQILKLTALTSAAG